jgi:hypothetical protein
VPSSPVEQTFAVYADAIEAVELTKRAALQAARSWVGGAKAALPKPAVQPDPWALIDIGFDFADLYVTVQTWYARTVLQSVAETMEAFTSGGTHASSPPPPSPAQPASSLTPATPAPRAPKAATPDAPAATPKAATPDAPAATPKATGSSKRPAPSKRPTA